VLPYIFMLFLMMFPVWIKLRVDKNTKKFLLGILFLILLLFIGLRYKVGGDWYSYLFYYDVSVGKSLKEVLFLSDPGYMIINWLCGLFGFGIQGVNIISGAIFLFGLFFFIERLKLSYIAYFIAFPYMITIIAMGYTRQSIALGILMIAYVMYVENKFYKTIFFILLAAMFHKTAIFGVIIFLADKRTLFKPIYLIVGLLVAFLVFKLMQHKFDTMYNVYIGRNAFSGGAIPRLALNAISGITYILFYKKFKEIGNENQNLWLFLSIVTIASFFLIPFSSTVADRLSLYLLPLQLVVWSRFPYLFDDNKVKLLIYFGIVIMYTSYFFVWMFFANHRFQWIPYQNFLFL